MSGFMVSKNLVSEKSLGFGLKILLSPSVFPMTQTLMASHEVLCVDVNVCDDINVLSKIIPFKHCCIVLLTIYLLYLVFCIYLYLFQANMCD